MFSTMRCILQALHHQKAPIKPGLRALSTSSVQWRKRSYLETPEDYSDINLPERVKLPVLPKVPFGGTTKIHKMKKNLHFMRGPEEVHNALLHEQYGIMALTGGRLKYNHMEVIRLKVAKFMDQEKCFAIWRVDAPWQPVTKRGIGKRHGGGKGPIDHYVTPVKAGRIIIEVGGKLPFVEIQPWLKKIADILPFRAVAVDQKTLLAMKKLEEMKEARNINPYTYKYLMMNTMCGSHNWVSPRDRLWFGKYV